MCSDYWIFRVFVFFIYIFCMYFIYVYIFRVFGTLSGPALSMSPLPPCICIIWAQNTRNVPSSQTRTHRLREIGKGSPPAVPSRYLAASPGAMTGSEGAQPGWAHPTLDVLGSPRELCIHLIRSCVWGNPPPPLQSRLSNDFRATHPKTNVLSCKDPWRAFVHFIDE